MQKIEPQINLIKFNGGWKSVPLTVIWTLSSWLPATVRASYQVIGIWVSINQTVQYRGKYFQH